MSSPTYVQSNADIYEHYKAKGVNMISPVEDFNGNGLYLFGKNKAANAKDQSLVVALHQGVIDSQTWLRVQYRLAENIQFGHRNNGKATWLSGLTKCTHCGYSMTGNRIKDKVFFRCSRKVNVGDCISSAIPAELVENQVWQAILEKVDELRGIHITQKNDADVRTNKLKLQLIKIDESIENLVSAIAEGNSVSVKLFSEKIACLDEERTAINEQLQKITVESTTINSDAILKLMEGELDFDEKHGIAKALIKKVLIAGRDEPLTVEWLF